MTLKKENRPSSSSEACESLPTSAAVQAFLMTLYVKAYFARQICGSRPLDRQGRAVIFYDYTCRRSHNTRPLHRTIQTTPEPRECVFLENNMLRAPIWDSHFLPQLGERGGLWGLRGQWQSFEAEVDWGQGPLSSICLLTPSVVLTRASLLCFYWVRNSSNTKNYFANSVTPVHLELLFYCICCRDLSSRANLTAQTGPTLSTNYYCLMDAFSPFFISLYLWIQQCKYCLYGF